MYQETCKSSQIVLRFIQGFITSQPQTMTNQENQPSGICTTAIVRGPVIVFKYDDGSEDETDFDLSTREGQLNFAAEAERRGLGCRKKIASTVSAPVGDGPILHRMNGSLPK
jgi:hypothetical protein